MDKRWILKGRQTVSLSKPLVMKTQPSATQDGALSGEEVSWLRIVSGRSEEERRRIKLGPRDLLSIELACNAVLSLSVSPLYQDRRAQLPTEELAPAAIDLGDDDSSESRQAARKRA